jgi:hypothetical protein
MGRKIGLACQFCNCHDNSQTWSRGYFEVELEARLLICEIEASDDPPLARLHAKTLEVEVRSRGFELLAHKAQAVESASYTE